MNTLYMIIRYLRNLLPYLLFIVIYFFFVNLEASKERIDNKNIEKEFNLPVVKSNVDDGQLRIRIPVIPYEQ